MMEFLGKIHWLRKQISLHPMLEHKVMIRIPSLSPKVGRFHDEQSRLLILCYN